MFSSRLDFRGLVRKAPALLLMLCVFDLPARSGWMIAISATPNPVGFGNAVVGTAAVASVSIMNNSGATVTLATPFTIVGPDASQFSVGAPGTTTLAAGGSTSVSATFAPTTSGTKSATLNIGTTVGETLPVGLSGTGTVGAVSEIVISEFRVRGPAGGNDEFIELYNRTDAAINISGWRIAANGTSGVPSDRLTVPANTFLPSHRHFLAVGSMYSGTVAGDRAYATAIADAGGIGLYDQHAVIVDQVGFAGLQIGFVEGNPLAGLGVTNQDRCYERKPGGAFGNGQDINDNQSDFQPVSPCSPQNLASPAVPNRVVSGRVVEQIVFGGPAPIRAVTHAKMTLSGNGLPAPLIVYTTRLGNFSFGGLFPGTYTLTVSHRRYHFSTPSRNVDVTAGDVTGADFLGEAN